MDGVQGKENPKTPEKARSNKSRSDKVKPLRNLENIQLSPFARRRNFSHSVLEELTQIHQDQPNNSLGVNVNEPTFSGDEAGSSTSNTPMDPDRRRGSHTPSAGPRSRREMLEHQVTSEADEVVRSFMVSTHQLNLRHQMGEERQANRDIPPEINETPAIGELETFGTGTNPFSEATTIGRKLAHMGDEFQVRYQSELDKMIQDLTAALDIDRGRGGTDRAGFSRPPSFKEAYEGFRSVARRIFHQDGCAITWGRVIALLSFGYRLAMVYFRLGVHDFLSRCVRLVVAYLMQEGITKWIADCGGWIASRCFGDEGGFHNSPLASALSTVITFACLLVVAFHMTSRR